MGRSEKDEKRRGKEGDVMERELRERLGRAGK